MSEQRMLELQRLQHTLEEQKGDDTGRSSQGGDLSIILGAWLGQGQAAGDSAASWLESRPSLPHKPRQTGVRATRGSGDPDSTDLGAPAVALIGRELLPPQRRAQVVVGAAAGGSASSGKAERGASQMAEGGRGREESCSFNSGDKSPQGGRTGSYDASVQSVEGGGMERIRLQEDAGRAGGGASAMLSNRQVHESCGASEASEARGACRLGVTVDLLVPAQVLCCPST